MNEMKHFIWLATSAVALLAHPVLAQAKGKAASAKASDGQVVANVAQATSGVALPLAKQIAANDKQGGMPVKETNRLVGHLTLAAQAIDLGLKGSAISNLDKAKAIAAAIIKSRPELISTFDYHYGKTSYEIGDVEKDYYLPIVDDIFVQGSFKEAAKGGKAPKVAEKGVQVVQLKLQLNLKNVAAAIDATEKLVNADKLLEARKSLDDIYKGSISSEEVVTDPMWTLWANFNLAQDFLKDGQYKSVRFALAAARANLTTLETSGVLKKNGPEAKLVSNDIDQVEKTLDEKDPSTFERIEKKLKGWAHKVKAWL